MSDICAVQHSIAVARLSVCAHWNLCMCVSPGLCGTWACAVCGHAVCHIGDVGSCVSSECVVCEWGGSILWTMHLSHE